jgi:hypothetical protein
VLNAYVRENFGRFIIVNFGDKAHVLAAPDGSSTDKASTRLEVMGRIEQGNVHGFVDFFIEERLLKSYCSLHSFGYATLKKELSANFMVQHIARKDMTAKTSSVPMRVNAVKITMRVDEIDAELARSVAMG